MATSNSVRCKAMLMELAVIEWFAQNDSEEKVKVKELMDFFIEKKIFLKGSSDSQIREVLNRLYDGNDLDLFPHALGEPVGMGMKWYFQRLDSDGAAKNATKTPKYSKEVERYRSALFANYKG